VSEASVYLLRRSVCMVWYGLGQQLVSAGYRERGNVPALSASTTRLSSGGFRIEKEIRHFQLIAS